MRRCVIVGGAAMKDYDFIRKYLRENDFFVFCDSGLSHMDRLSVKPDLIVGDFDSHCNPHTGTETIVLPCEKDDTDTVFAVKEALTRGFEEFFFIGVAGGRMDHTLANISILLFLAQKGKKACIADDYSLMEMVGKETVLIADDCLYFSLLNISGIAKGIYVENAKYPLRDAEIDCTYQYGVSNEVLPGTRASVSVREGNLLLVRIYREEN